MIANYVLLNKLSEKRETAIMQICQNAGTFGIEKRQDVHELAKQVAMAHPPRLAAGDNLFELQLLSEVLQNRTAIHLNQILFGYAKETGETRAPQQRI